MSYPATLFVAPMFLFSGTFFPLHLLPQIVQVLALLLLPLTHVVSLIRGLLTETSVPLWALNISWIVMGTIIFSFLAIRLFERRLVV
jgi:lipooligosaccharide transport system permease protein